MRASATRWPCPRINSLCPFELRAITRKLETHYRDMCDIITVAAASCGCPDPRRQAQRRRLQPARHPASSAKVATRDEALGVTGDQLTQLDVPGK